MTDSPFWNITSLAFLVTIHDGVQLEDDEHEIEVVGNVFEEQFKKWFIMDLTGKCIRILEPQSGISAKSGEEWVKNSFVIEIAGQYPTRVAFTVFGEDRWTQMGIAVGGQYQVSFDIDAREWQGRWFNDLSAWKAVRIGGQQQQTQSPALQQTQSPVPEAPTGGQQQSDGSDLPF